MIKLFKNRIKNSRKLMLERLLRKMKKAGWHLDYLDFCKLNLISDTENKEHTLEITKEALEYSLVFSLRLYITEPIDRNTQ